MRYLLPFFLLFVLSGIEILSAEEPTEMEMQGERGIRQVAVTQEKPSPHKTLLIGINEYMEPMSKLTYCMNDMKMLAETFEKVGIDSSDMILMTDDAPFEQHKPNRANIFRQLRTLMRDATEDDTITILFSGHGLHLDGVSYLCPNDADPDVPETLISHREITRIMDASKAKRKLFLIDACRNTPVLKGGRDGPNVNNGFDKVFDTAKGTAFLLSCSEGEVTWEFEELNHGAFSYFISQGLSGEADENEDGEVSLQELIRYVSEHTKKYVKEKRDRNQTPSFKGDIADSLDKFILTRKGAKPKPKTKEHWVGRMVFGKFGGHCATVFSMDISPDSKILATASFDGTIRLWDTQTDKAIHTFRDTGSLVWDVKFSPDGKTLLTSHGNVPENPAERTGFITSAPRKGFVILWNLETYERIRTIEAHLNFVSTSVFSPDGKDIFTAGGDFVIKRWNIESGELVNVTEGHEGPIRCLAISPDGKTMASGSVDDTVRVWTEDYIFSMKFSNVFIGSVDFSSDSQDLFVGTSGGDAFRLGLEQLNNEKREGTNISAIPKLSGPIQAVRFSPLKNSVATTSPASKSGTILWDMETLEPVQIFWDYTGNKMWSCRFSQDEKFLFTGSQGGLVHKWDATLRKDRATIVHKLNDGFMPNYKIVYSPDGKMLCLASGENAVLMNALTSEIIHTFQEEEGVEFQDVAFSPDSKSLAYGTGMRQIFEIPLIDDLESERSKVKIWDIEQKEWHCEPISHSNTLIGVWFSPDGRILITADRRERFRFFNRSTGEGIHELLGIKVVCAKFSADGSKLLIGLSNGNTSIQDIGNWKGINLNDQLSCVATFIASFTPERTRYLQGRGGPVTAVAFSPNGKSMLTGGADNVVRLWDNEGEERIVWRHASRVTDVAFSPNGQYAASASLDGTVVYFHTDAYMADTLDVAHSKTYYNRQPVYSIAFTPDGSGILMGRADGEARLWSTKRVEPLAVYPDPKSRTLLPWTLSVSPNGKRLAVGGKTNLVKQWNLETGVEAAEDFTSGSGSVYCIRYSHDGKRLACAISGNAVPLHENTEDAEQWETENAEKIDEHDITARIYNVADGKEQLVLCGHKNRLLAVEFTPDDKHILTGCMDRTIRLWDAETGKELRVFQADSGVASLDILQDGKRFVTGHANGTVNLWDLESESPLRSMKGDNGIIWQVSASPNGRLLLSCGFENPTRLWNLETGEVIRQIANYSGTEAVAFSPDGKYYLITTRSGSVSLRLLANDVPIVEFGLGQGNAVRAFTFTPDGQSIVTSFWNGEVVLWE